jgi:hypothetical protein
VLHGGDSAWRPHLGSEHPAKLPSLARGLISGLAGVMSLEIQSGAYADLVVRGGREHPWRGSAPRWSDHRRMKLLHVALIMSALLFGAGGCSAYDPPVEGDHTSEKYQAEVATCRTASTETVRLKNAATPGRWIISPITGPPAVRAAIRTCMVSKGYVLQKTDD